jgi:hypothetical protein
LCFALDLRGSGSAGRLQSRYTTPGLQVFAITRTCAEAEGKRKMRVLFTLLVHAGFLAVQQVIMSFFTDDDENNSKESINYY